MTIQSLALNPSVYMNREFRVKVSTLDNSRGYLVGYAGLVSLVGISRALTYIYKAYQSSKDKTSFSSRHRRITFYNK